MRIVAVDDEPLALKRVGLLLERIPGVELIGTASGADAALVAIEELRPDILLLDIKLIGASGLDLVEKLTGPFVPSIIFVTAFGQFATSAFEMGAVDYVLKPIALDRLNEAIGRARRSLFALDAEERIRELHSVVAALREQTAASEAKRYETEIWAERRNEYVRISVEDLDWVAAERDYVRLYAHGQSYLLRDTMSSIQARLDPTLYTRIRRSALVRIDRVAGIRKAGYGDVRITLIDGSDIRVGRTYVKQIRKLITPRGSLGDSAPVAPNKTGAP